MYSIFRRLFRFNNYIRSYHNAVPVQMSYEVFEGQHTNNSKPPLMVMHGVFGSKKNWRTICRSLKEQTDRKIICLDARNHGESPHTPEHSSAHMTADIMDLMKRLGIPQTSVMGHSMGGRTMMYLALKYPQYVSNGIIVDISPLTIPRGVLQMEEIFRAMKNVNIPSDLSMGQARKFAETEIKRVVDQKETVDFILLNLRKNNGSYSWSVNVEALLNNLSHFGDYTNTVLKLNPYEGKMMFVCGTESSFVDPKSWPEIQKLFPNSEIHWLDAGHLVHFDQPVEFSNLVAKFLNR